MSILFLFAHLNLATACFCNWKGGLVKNAQNSTLTIHGKVSNILRFDKPGGKTFEVEVLSKLKGEGDKKIITILGSDGTDCRYPLWGFEIGTEWILSLSQVKDEGYQILFCGEHIIPVKKNRAWGYILYDDKCSINEPMSISLDSLQLAINNPTDFIYPRRSCRTGESEYFVDANHLPLISESQSIHEYLKEKLNITGDLKKEYNDYLLYEIFFDTTGHIEKIRYKNAWAGTEAMKEKYGGKIIKLLKAASPWIPAKHWGENIPMKLILRIDAKNII